MNFASNCNTKVKRKLKVYINIISIIMFEFQVTIFFSTLKTDNIGEKPEIGGSEFRNQLGGALALYLGISFVSFFEVVELLIRLLLSPFGIFRPKREQEMESDDKKVQGDK